jgi:hypothetical protein
VSAIKLLPNRAQLPLLEFADRDAAQRSTARVTAAYISFKTARCPNACGMIFVRRRSSGISAPGSQRVHAEDM